MFSTIDRVMANMKWLHLFENAEVAFLPEGEFDHCPGVVCMYPGEHNMWVQSNHFMDVVKRSWERNVHGCSMYRLMQKLKRLKRELKALNKEGFSDVQVNAARAYQKLVRLHNLVHENPGSMVHTTAEKEASKEYRRAQDTYMSFLRQKSKAQWIDKGDENTRMFHQCIKARRSSNKIHSIQDGNGIWVNEGVKVKEAFVSFYDTLLNQQLEGRCEVKR